MEAAWRARILIEGQSSGRFAKSGRSVVVVDAIVLFVVAVIVVNLAFVVIPARGLRQLLTPPQRPVDAPEYERQPARTPVRDRAAWTADRVTKAQLADRHAQPAIVLRSALAGAVPGGMAGD